MVAVKLDSTVVCAYEKSKMIPPSFPVVYGPLPLLQCVLYPNQYSHLMCFVVLLCARELPP